MIVHAQWLRMGAAIVMVMGVMSIVVAIMVFLMMPMTWHR